MSHNVETLTGEAAADRGYVECLIDGAAGIYVPSEFMSGFNLEAWGIDPTDDRYSDATDPDAEYYWEAWANVLQDAKYIDPTGKEWYLWQDGDLFAHCCQDGSTTIYIDSDA